MKLHYFTRASNFGDALNPWLWPRLLPGFFDDDESSVFVGIGTLLNMYLPTDSIKVVFGAGYGYGFSIPVIDDRWRIYCVRGPLTARELGIEPALAITDAGVLIRAVSVQAQPKRYRYAFMPHWESTLCWDWRAVCDLAGIHFIDPLAPVETVLADILGSEVVLTEAMHGAIVADALRVPWIPMAIYPRVLAFKWHDWLASIGREYQPHTLVPLHPTDTLVSQWINRLRPVRIRRPIEQALHGQSRSAHAAHRLVLRAADALRQHGRLETQRAAQALDAICRGVEPGLSADTTIETLTDRLLTTLEQLVQDHQAGRLTPRTSVHAER